MAAVGVNCTSPEYVADLLRHMRERTDKPLLAYPNSGERYEAITKRWSGSQAAAPFSEMARTWYQAGARLIGGCCRTTPDDIRAIGEWRGS